MVISKLHPFFAGKSTQLERTDLGMGSSVVMTLLNPYFSKGHVLYTDNFYTSPLLGTFLLGKNTGFVGTVRPNRKKMPKFPKLDKGETCCLENNSMYALKWVDKREVHILSSLHTDSMTHVTNGWKSTRKPNAVLDYNKNMRLIDKCDMQITGLSCMRKSFKWYRKFFFHLVDVYRLNAFYLYKLSTGDDIKLRDFIYNVSMQLLEEFSNVSNEATEPQNANIRANLDLRKHYLAEICRGFSGAVLRRRCVVCAKNNQFVRSSYECNSCKVALCIDKCFVFYHENIADFQKDSFQ